MAAVRPQRPDRIKTTPVVKPESRPPDADANQTLNDALISLDDVSYRYPKGTRSETLDHIDLDVSAGRYLLISGASGSGKSTLVRTFNGLIPHFYGGRLTGRVTVGGQSVLERSVAQWFHRVGMVAQIPRSQLFNRTVTQELAFGLESLGMPRQRMKARIASVAEDMGITPLLERNPQTLSGGEQQLVAIAAVLVSQPEVVVLDEPLANLDPAHIRRLRIALARLLDQGVGIVVCEHRMAPTLPDAHHLVVLKSGRILIQGPKDAALADSCWAHSSVELPLAVRMAADLNRPVSQIDQLAREDIHAWLQADSACPHVSSATGGPTVLQAENISWSRKGRRILKEIDLTLCAGQCTALVGANGAGKTTLLKVINGLIRPATGRILINGHETTGKPAWQVGREVGTAFQNPDSQFFKLTVAQELAVGPKALGRHDPKWLDKLIELFHLEHLVDRAPFKLSGGEKKRVAFAAALAAKPSVLVLDEPTAGQDGRFRRTLAEVIQQLCRQGTAILIVTHALNFAETVASHWVVMTSGRIAARGRPQEIMADRALLEKAGLEPTERFNLWQRARPNH
jgi:energy-coupling factor transport system ATP-binding protein